MKQLKLFLNMFTIITTGTILICALTLTLNGVEQWTTDILWQIPGVGLVTALFTVIVLPDKEFSRREYFIRLIIHFILIAAIVLFAGSLFNWYDITFMGCVIMTLKVAAVYAFTYFTDWLSCKHSADELNRALEKRRNGK